ncbi:hypothetical protein bcgnr5369_35150 [Bacillus cereus]
MAEFNREETNKLKEEYTKDDCWVQDLFSRFYKLNWHLPNEITAMREILYEKTGVRVVKPGGAKIIKSSFRLEDIHKKRDEVPEEEFDWSNYDK